MTKSLEDINAENATYPVSIKMNKKIVDLIDEQRKYNRMSRSSWVSQAVIEKLSRLGVEIHENE